MPPSIDFVRKIPIHRRKRELIIIIIIFILATSTIFFFSYVINSPLFLSKYSKIYIRCEEDPNYDKFVNCTFELTSNDESENVNLMNARIKIRGSNTNWNEKSPKKGYRIELSRGI